MDPPIETAQALAALCRKHEVSVIWDPGVYAENGLGALLPTLRNTDYFVLNHLEYENILGTSDPKGVMTSLTGHVKGVKAIIKNGAKGSTLCLNASGATITMDAVPLARLGMHVVNTVGCGDAFIGGFASAKVEGFDDMESLRMASAAGSFKATRKETRGGPTREQLMELIERWKAL